MYMLWNQTACSTSENPPLTGWVARICLQARRPWIDSWVGKIRWRKGSAAHSSIHGLASLVAQMVKNPPAEQETWILPLGWGDPLEEDMTTHSSILARRISMDRGAWWATVHGIAKSQTWLSNYAPLGGVLWISCWSPLVLLWVFGRCLAVFLSQNCLGIRWVDAGYKAWYV